MTLLNKITFSFFLLTISYFSFSQNTSYIYLDDVRDGKYLYRAKNTSVDTFFDRIISNGFELEKNNRKWRVVAETINHVYYGVIVTAENGLALVQNFCKTDGPKVKKLFPIYENTDGVNIKAKLYYQYIFDLEQHTLRPACDKRYKIDYDRYNIKLTDNGIRVNMTTSGYCYDEKVLKVTINSLLDPNSLGVIEENVTIEDKINPENNTEEKSLINNLKINIFD